MGFRLYSTGKLLNGFDEPQAVVELHRITGLPTEKIRTLLLSGQRCRLAASEDQAKIETFRDRLMQAGLAVELVADALPESKPSQPPVSTARAPERSARNTGPTPLSRRIAVVAGFLVLVAGITGGAGWYWLNRPLGDDALAVEAAVADGSLVAIAHMDVEKIIDVRTRWFGATDPAPISLADEDDALLKRLLGGKTDFRNNLHHAFLAVNGQPATKNVETTLVLAGLFDEGALLAALTPDYRLESLGGGVWSMTRKPPTASEIRCPDESPPGRPPIKTQFLRITPQWLLISSSTDELTHMFGRLSGRAAASQELATWRSYRQGQLASLMVFLPGEATKAMAGLPGMIARKVTNDTPQVTGFAAHVDLSPLRRGLRAGVTVSSDDAAWNNVKGSQLRQKLQSASRDGRSVSPSLGRLLSRITVEDTAHHLQVDLDLDGEMLSEMGQTMQEAVANLLAMGFSSGRPASTPVGDEILKSPNNYAANASLEKLPAYEPNKFFSPPLFVNGSFAVDLASIERNGEGLFEFKIKGRVALPKSENQAILPIGKLSLAISDVNDAAGKSLLRDEQCIKGPMWQKKNHEPAMTEFLAGDSASVEKSVRLNAGVVPEQVATIDGRVELVAPVQVKRFALPVTAGGHVEHMGVRFFLRAVGNDGSVSFQLSGDKERFLELRALNRKGEPLQSDWSMGDTQKGRVTRHFKGNVEALEIYVAERFAKHETTFTLREVFAPTPAKQSKPARRWLAPASIPARAWSEYTALDIDKLHASPEDAKWHHWDGKQKPIASFAKAPVAVELFHEQQAWSTSPEAKIYFPMLPGFPGSLSTLSYQLDEPKGKHSGQEIFVPVSYPYYADSGKIVIEHQIKGKPYASYSTSLALDLKKGERLNRLKGRLRFRLPTKTTSTRFGFDELWQGKSIDGLNITLTRIERGMAVGYSMKVEGRIDRFVNLHGLTESDERIPGEQFVFQNSGYWTMVIPLVPGMRQVELVTATEQKVYEYPFDVAAHYEP